MRKKGLLLLSLWAFILACQVIPTPPALKPTPPGRDGKLTPSIAISQEASPNPQSTIIASTPDLPSFELTLMPAFPEQPFADTTLLEWQGPGNSDRLDNTSLDLGQIANRGVIAGLTASQQRYLMQNGFVVVQTRETQFSDIRQQVSLSFGQPYFLTTDAASHAMKLTVDQLLNALEREELHRRLTQIVQATLDEVQRYLPYLQDSAIEKDAKLAAAYLAVGLRLLDASVDLPLDADIQALVSARTAQVLSARGVENLILFPGVQADLSVYQALEIATREIASWKLITWERPG